MMDGSFILGLVCGVCMGAMGHHYFQKKIGLDRDAQDKYQVLDKLHQLFVEFPEFMEQLQQDLSNPEYDHIDEFFLIPKEAIMTTLIPRLRYDYSENLMPLFHQLEKLNYISRLPNDALLYRIEQDFHIALSQYSDKMNTHISEMQEELPKLNVSHEAN